MDFYRSEPRPLPTVTAETPLDASVTLYLRAGAPTAARDRQRNARARVEALADEGLLPDFGVEEWPSKAVVPNDGPTDPAIGTRKGMTGVPSSTATRTTSSSTHSRATTSGPRSGRWPSRPPPPRGQSEGPGD